MSVTETATSMRRLNGRYNNAIEEIDDCVERQARGENVDESEFLKLLQKRVVVQDAMEAVVKFETKTMKTVLNEAK